MALTPRLPTPDEASKAALATLNHQLATGQIDEAEARLIERAIRRSMAARCQLSR